MKTLKIVDGQTFGIHIDETIDEDNLFYHEYTIAASYLNNIWINQDGIIRGKLKTYFDVPEYPNNVIAFCGDRGTGKSSAMATFVNELKKTKNKENILNFIDDVRDNDWDTNIIIDPSMFDGVHNIIDVVLAHLYQSFKKAYKLVQRFFTNINAFFTAVGLESMDLSRLWLPVRIDDQGEVIGTDIDICRIYSDIFAVQEQKTKDGLKEYESNNSNTLYTVNDVQQWKQKFVQQVSNVASQDYTRKVGTIPSFLKNKTSKYAKEKLETIANGIQKFSFKEKKLPDNFDPERIIRLYYGIVDQLLKDPASSISDQQAAEYKDIAEIRKVIGN